MPALEATSVAELLRNRDTRNATLSALEEHAAPIDCAVSVAAARVLGELMALDTSEVGPEQWDRTCLLFARLCAEADADPTPVFSAAFGGGRLEAAYQSDGNALARALLKPAEELTLEDARRFASFYAWDPPGMVRDGSKLMQSLGMSVFDYIKMWMTEDPLIFKCAPRPPLCGHLLFKHALTVC